MTAPTITEQSSTAVKATTKLDPRALTDSAADLLNAMAALPANHPSRARTAGPRHRGVAAARPAPGPPLRRTRRARRRPGPDRRVGLIKAVDNFDPTRGVDFTGYAIPTIIGEIKRHFRDRTWAVRVPRRLQELRLSITAANSSLTQTLGRSPTVADIAAHLELTEETSWRGWRAPAPTGPRRCPPRPATAAGTELGDTLGGEDSAFELAELRVALGPALATLPNASTRS